MYPQDRYLPRIDCGSYSFSFRIYKGGIADAVRLAELFNRRPYVINAFPTGSGGSAESISVDGGVVVSTVKKRESGCGTVLRVFNPLSESSSFTVSVGGRKKEFTIAPYKFTAVVFDGKELFETSPSEI